jgi:hypothetical protein
VLNQPIKTWLAALDEMNIVNVSSYGIVDIMPIEIADLQKNGLYNDTK